ncbi:MAG: hypothetical protein A2Y13_08130 [Planctomycetes bacterium GWC2_45_44]|nr:MAG: hypothetical protein A2Y13_08130 [Planctomycetes bacterium GWC2_45_44]
METTAKKGENCRRRHRRIIFYRGAFAREVTKKPSSPFSFQSTDLCGCCGHCEQSRIDELLPSNWKPPLKKAKIAEDDLAA